MKSEALKSTLDSMGVQLGISGADGDCNLAIGGRRTDWKDTKAVKAQNDVACTERYLSSAGVAFTKVVAQEQYSMVDALAELGNGSKRKFQVTSIWPSDFWEPLGATGAVDRKITLRDLGLFIQTAIDPNGNIQIA